MIRNDHYLAGGGDPCSLGFSCTELEVEKSERRFNKVKALTPWEFTIKLFETSLKK
jgi:hypothetical protein